MDRYAAIIFCILGAGSGVMIPFISDQIISYKNKKQEGAAKVRGFQKKLYVLFPVLNGFLWALAGMAAKDILTALFVSLLLSVSVLIAVIDLRIRLIPNELILVMLILGILLQIVLFGWFSLIVSVLCMAAAGFVFALTGKLVGFEQVGAGDVKLAAGMGFVLGYPHMLFAFAWMGGTLVLFCVAGLALRKLTRYSTFPFAPFMMFGMAAALIDMVGTI